MLYCSRCSLFISNMNYFIFFFFFSSRRRHTRCLSDWSSDVCSSDLSAHTRRPELIVLEQLVHEDANGAFERMQHVVERYDRMRHEMSPEELEVLFRAAIGVIAVDPQEPDRSIPTFRQIP